MTMKGRHHTEETKRRISESNKRAKKKNRPPLEPQLCHCGCGEYATVDERRNRVSKYRSGHNAGARGHRHTEETRAKIRVKRALQGPTRSVRTPVEKSNYSTWRSWMSMLWRVDDPRNASYSAYGGRGITVCERWRSFENFLADMGPRPDGTSIDRINSDGNYEPGNCRWATKKEQRANSRDPWITRRANQAPKLEH